MDINGIGAGLAALAFWGFVAVAVVATMWDGIRKREAQHETLRRLIESGQHVDQELVDQILRTPTGSGRPDRDFKVTALWIAPVGPGLVLFALILGSQHPQALWPILGAAALVSALGVGFWLAGKVSRPWYDEDGA